MVKIMQSKIKCDEFNIIHNTFCKTLKSGYIVVFVNVEHRDVDFVMKHCSVGTATLDLVFEDCNDNSKNAIVSVNFDNVEQMEVMYQQIDKTQFSFLFIPRSEFLV